MANQIEDVARGIKCLVYLVEVESAGEMKVAQSVGMDGTDLRNDLPYRRTLTAKHRPREKLAKLMSGLVRPL